MCQDLGAPPITAAALPPGSADGLGAACRKGLWPRSGSTALCAPFGPAWRLTNGFTPPMLAVAEAKGTFATSTSLLFALGRTAVVPPWRECRSTLAAGDQGDPAPRTKAEPERRAGPSVARETPDSIFGTPFQLKIFGAH